MAQISDINTATNLKDIQLLRKIAEKDTDSLSEFYDLHSKYLYTMIYYILKDEAEAEDLLQEVFLQIWEKVDSYDETLGNPLAWVTRMTRNKSIDRLRSKSYKNRSSEIDIERIFDLSGDSETTGPDNISNRTQEQTEITNALKSLSQNQRDLIEFAYFRGYSQTELAEYFKIPLGTVKTRMRSAMISLRDKLKYLL